MSKNPFLNAVLATLYIVVVSSFMFYGPRVLGQMKDNVLMPISMLSLFVLSAAMMGFLFLYQPGQMYFDGNKKEAVNFFLKTLGSFALITIVSFAILFSGILSR